MVSTRQALTVDVRARGTGWSSTRVRTGGEARSWASLSRVRAMAHERRRSGFAPGLIGVAFPGAPRRPVWQVVRVVGDTQRRPGGREKRGRRAGTARDDRQ